MNTPAPTPPLRTPRHEAIRDATFGFPFLPGSLGPLWQLQEWVPFWLNCDDPRWRRRYLIPNGYKSDKASIPTIFWGPPFNYIPDGLCSAEAFNHDFLCDLLAGGSDWLKQALYSCPICDGVDVHVPDCDFADIEMGLPPAPPAEVIHEHFRRGLHAWGVRPRKAEAMGRAVALFGPGGKLRPSTIWRKIRQIVLLESAGCR